MTAGRQNRWVLLLAATPLHIISTFFFSRFFRQPQGIYLCAAFDNQDTVFDADRESLCELPFSLVVVRRGQECQPQLQLVSPFDLWPRDPWCPTTLLLTIDTALAVTTVDSDLVRGYPLRLICVVCFSFFTSSVRLPSWREASPASIGKTGSISPSFLSKGRTLVRSQRHPVAPFFSPHGGNARASLFWDRQGTSLWR